MEIVTWIDKKVSEINQTPLFKKYFDGIRMEKVEHIPYFMNALKGIDIVLTEDYFVKAIHLHSGNKKDARKFEDVLPAGLNFSFPRTRTRELLGSPFDSGGGDYIPVLGKFSSWDKYKFDTHYLHVQFSDDERKIDMVTLDSLKEE